MIVGRRFLLRPYRAEDAISLPNVAGDWEVARWMTAAFPHPYTAADALTWVAIASSESPVDNFAIEIEGVLAGGIGIRPLHGESTGVAEFGYWLGREHWGRGIATEASHLLIGYAFGERALRRLEAHVFAPNGASARVLEKCGFTLEGVLRQAVRERDGNVLDALLYARVRSNASVAI
jgi:ribosomal-protein-alanine N-acetyltransferase